MYWKDSSQHGKKTKPHYRKEVGQLDFCLPFFSILSFFTSDQNFLNPFYVVFETGQVRTIYIQTLWIIQLTSFSWICQITHLSVSSPPHILTILLSFKNEIRKWNLIWFTNLFSLYLNDICKTYLPEGGLLPQSKALVFFCLFL